MDDMKNNIPIMVRMTDVHKSFGSMEALKGINLTVQKGEVLALLGPSGSGKSTLLRCINKLETIDSGSIEIMGNFLAKNDSVGKAEYVNSAQERKILANVGMVFQHFNLFPHMTVLENIIEGPTQVKKMSRAEAVPIADELLRKVGLYDKRDVYPARLSGGQQQRVAIARALAMKPEVMLFDEPTSALDPELTVEVLQTMRELAEEKMTMIVVTHEMGFAREVASAIAFLSDGIIVERTSSKEFFENPKEERTKAFLQKMLR